MAAKLAGRFLKCHLFEANAAICRYLEDSSALYPDIPVTINHGVVSDVPGQSAFEINAHALGESTVTTTGGSFIQNIVLDDYIEAHRLDCVDFAKFDIEGWEPIALKGAARLLRAGIFKTIYLEVVLANLEKHGFRIADAVEPLQNYGYDVFFCKQADREDGRVPADFWKVREVNGHQLQLAPFRPQFGVLSTDLLAIHRSLR